MDYYTDCLKRLKEFSQNKITLDVKALNECLRNVLGHETCECIQNPNQPLSISDIRTDLAYMFAEVNADQNHI
jgi:hypothetical protein